MVVSEDCGSINCDCLDCTIEREIADIEFLREDLLCWIHGEPECVLCREAARDEWC